ncbi:MAG TPA: class I SAM-dependent methyltransferase [Gallionellaceae bacterium]
MRNEDEEIFREADFVHFNCCPICESTQVENIGMTSTIHPNSRFSVSIMRCLNCRHWYTDPTPKPELLSRLYAESSLSVLGESWAKVVECSNQMDSVAPDSHWVVRSLSEVQPGNLLEVGPGDGSLLRKMRERGWNAFGVDLGRYASGFQVVSSPDQLPKSILFDVVIFQDVLEHTSSPSDVLSNYLDYLSPNAILFMTVPWSESKRAGLGKAGWEMVRPLGHLHYFSKQSASILLKSRGFEVLASETVNIYGSYPIELARSFLSVVYGSLRTSKWKSLYRRVRNFCRLLSLFPGDAAGDQLYLKAQRTVRCKIKQ